MIYVNHTKKVLLWRSRIGVNVYWKCCSELCSSAIPRLLSGRYLRKACEAMLNIDLNAVFQVDESFLYGAYLGFVYI